jgi:hypothetical protein
MQGTLIPLQLPYKSDVFYHSDLVLRFSAPIFMCRQLENDPLHPLITLQLPNSLLFPYPLYNRSPSHLCLLINSSSSNRHPLPNRASLVIQPSHGTSNRLRPFNHSLPFPFVQNEICAKMGLICPSYLTDK